MSEIIVLEELEIEVLRSQKRESLEITVERNGELTLRIPKACSIDDATIFVKDKLLWIYGKLQQKELYQVPQGEKEIVNGEGFFYLGVSYRLQIVENQVEALKWNGDIFSLSLGEREKGKAHFVKWYIEMGNSWLVDRIQSLQNQFSVEVSEIRIQNIGNRWGSCSHDKSINLHWRLMLLPPKMIDYVLHHELAHIIHPNHSEDYWKTLETALPDYRERKDWLAKNGGLFYL